MLPVPDAEEEGHPQRRRREWAAAAERAEPDGGAGAGVQEDEGPDVQDGQWQVLVVLVLRRRLLPPDRRQGTAAAFTVMNGSTSAGWRPNREPPNLLLQIPNKDSGMFTGRARRVPSCPGTSLHAALACILLEAHRSNVRSPSELMGLLSPSEFSLTHVVSIP